MGTNSVSLPVKCCFSMLKKRISIQKLKSYTTDTSIYCPQEAVIFRTKDKEAQANPKENWVSDLIKHLDKISQSLKPCTFIPELIVRA
nr:C-C motif chemokine 8-like [Cavia porcellus]